MANTGLTNGNVQMENRQKTIGISALVCKQPSRCTIELKYSRCVLSFVHNVTASYAHFYI